MPGPILFTLLDIFTDEAIPSVNGEEEIPMDGICRPEYR